MRDNLCSGIRENSGRKLLPRPDFLRSRLRAGAQCGLGGVLVALMLVVWGGDRPRLLAAGGSEDSTLETAPKAKLRREGTQLLDEPGRFIVTGSQATFVAADGTSYLGLANLNLERVEKICSSSPASGEWLVSGTVTEYQGANYLLISRARRKAPTQTQRSF